MSKIKCFQGTSLQDEFELKVSQGIEEAQSVKEVITEQANKIIDKVNRLRAELELPLLEKIILEIPEILQKETVVEEVFDNDLDSVYEKAKQNSDFENFVEVMSDFRDGHSAPSKDEGLTKEKLETGGDFSLMEVANGFHNQPSDYFEPKVGARYYGYDNNEGMQSFTAISNVIRALKAGKDNVTITSYRAIPLDIDLDSLKDYDWVTFSKGYAENHGEARFGEKTYKIIEQEVKLNDLWWDGNDINEWGYDTGNTKKYSRRELKDIHDKVNALPQENLNSSSESKTLFEKMQEFKRMSQMKIEGDTLTAVNQNDIRVQLEQTLNLSDNLSISSDIIYLNELGQDLYYENIEDVKELIKEIEVKSAKQGVDIVGLSSKVFSKSRDEIYDLLESLNTLLLEPSEQSFNDFIGQHQIVFETEVIPITKVEVVSENNLNKSLISLKTKLSEYTLFNDFGLLKVSENIYQQIEKEDLDTLYNKLYAISQYNENILPKEAFPLANQAGELNLETLRNIENRELIVADIKRFIENEVSKLDVPSVSLDNTVLQQMVINKYAFGHPMTFKKNVDFQEEFNSFEAFDGNEEYLKTDFIADFYSEFLQEKIKDSEKYKEFYSNFSINERGIVLVNDDAITVQKIKDYLAEKNIKQAKDLENYSLLTDQIPNLKTLEKPSSDYTRDFYRTNYINNPMSLDKVKGEYKFITDTTIVKNNSIDNFIRVKDRVFELVDTKGGNSFYEEVPVNTSEYKTFNVSQPVLSVNLDNYGAERLDEVPPVKIEKYYSKAEEQKINEESFECL
jgi:hypothetical protein